MAKHHLIISGTGRAGTTFLVQLFSALGLDTGFSEENSQIFENCNAGMERDIHDPSAPYVVKSPFLCDVLDTALDSGQIVIDHAIIPIRDLFAAAESRRDVTARTDRAEFPNGAPGGLWNTEDPAKQEGVLTKKFYDIMHVIAKRDIPVTMIYFPKFIHDPEYLFSKLQSALKGVDKEKFLAAFRKTARPELVHEFNPGLSTHT